MMKKYLFLLFCCLYSLFVHSQIQYDWEQWTSVGLKRTFKNNISLDCNYQIRFDHDMRVFKSSYISAGLGYKLNKYVSFDVSYRYATNNSRDMHRFSGAIILNYKYKKLEFTLRNMYQNERFFFVRVTDIRYAPQNVIRERLQIAYSIIKPLKIYISSEASFRLDPNFPIFFRLRSIAGIDYKIKKSHTIGIAYMFQPDFPTTSIMQAITAEYTLDIPDWKKIKKVFKPKQKKN